MKRPEPLVPAGVDLRGLEYMPLNITQLTRSKSWKISKRKPELFRPLLALWMSAWQSVPAGSLEADDDELASAADLTYEQWQAIGPDLIRGWVLCSDGRYYVPGMVPIVLRAWGLRQAHVDRTAAARAAKLRAKQSPVTANVTDSVTDNGADPVTASNERMRERERERKGRTHAPNGHSPHRPRITDTCASCPSPGAELVNGTAYCQHHAQAQREFIAQRTARPAAAPTPPPAAAQPTATHTSPDDDGIPFEH